MRDVVTVFEGAACDSERQQELESSEMPGKRWIHRRVGGRLQGASFRRDEEATGSHGKTKGRSTETRSRRLGHF